MLCGWFYGCIFPTLQKLLAIRPQIAFRVRVTIERLPGDAEFGA
jgi:hypothetical protein